MVTSCAITQRLDRLEARGLVTRSPSAKNGSGVDAECTVIDRALPDHLVTEERLLHGLSRADREVLAAALRLLLESLEEPSWWS